MSGTVDWGIDLGTTNSAIAHMTPRGPELIPIRRMNYIPSAVARDKRGDLKIGADALNAHVDGLRLFKRMMGTGNMLSLGGEAWSPQMLSAEVLKALTAGARLKTGSEIDEVVITVPAMFSQPQCAATSEAANLAGLDAVALLQEPIAAATAYLSTDAAEGHYLVYDLGGGTFDVSLIKLQAGEMTVIEHGGDNYLGGGDFDRAIFDWVLDSIDRKAGDASIFASGWQRSQLMLACEEARIALSETELAPIYLDEFDLPLAKVDLNREVVEDLISDFVTRTIEVTRDRIRAVRSSVRAILLVGGPTQMPYVRHRLASDLGIPLGMDQDPMTVVAKGAAIFASGLRKKGPVAGIPQTEREEVVFDLIYDPVSPDEFAGVAGKLLSPQDSDVEVRVSSTDGSWQSGWMSLQNGVFRLEVALGRNVATEFRLESRDKQGRGIACQPETFVIRSGIRAAQPVAPYNYSVVRQGGQVGQLIRAGDPLPARGSDDFHLARAIAAGSAEEAVIYFVEGNSSFADENVRVGSLVIKGAELSRNLREGERLEIRIEMDASRRLSAKVHIPIVDEDFKVNLYSMQQAPDVEDLVSSLVEARTALSQMTPRADETEQETIIRANRRLEQLEAGLARVEKGEDGEAEKVQKQLADVKSSIRPLRDKYGLQERYDELVGDIRDSEELCDYFDDRMGKAKLQDFRIDAEKALRLKQPKTIEAIRDKVVELFWEHYGKTSACWEHQVTLLRQRAPSAKDPLAYGEYLHAAEKALAAEDYEGVRLSALRAYSLLPDTDKLRDRFHDAALR